MSIFPRIVTAIDRDGQTVRLVQWEYGSAMMQPTGAFRWKFVYPEDFTWIKEVPTAWEDLPPVMKEGGVYKAGGFEWNGDPEPEGVLDRAWSLLEEARAYMAIARAIEAAKQAEAEQRQELLDQANAAASCTILGELTRDEVDAIFAAYSAGARLYFPEAEQ